MFDENKFAPFFDQESPQVPLVGIIAWADHSEPYELDAAAVFKAERGYLVVKVSGCSCWPDRGTTQQTVCPHKIDVDRALVHQWGNWSDVIGMCQTNDWKPVEYTGDGGECT